MKRIVALSAFLSLALALVQPAAADVKVGDKPNLKFTAAGGGTVDLEQLRGKIVVIDFWATWCGPCMAEADHMVKLNETYGPRGMQFIGISLDQDREKMLATARAKRFDWPQYFDGKVWQNDIGRAWGINSIPATFIINPDGVVAWKGHPARIDAELDRVFRETPPRLIDAKVLAESSALADKLDAALKGTDTAAALKLLAGLNPEALKDPRFSKRLEPALKQLGPVADEAFAAAEAMLERKEFAPAIASLRDLSKLTMLPVGDKAAQRLAALQKDPAVKAQIEAAEKAEKQREREVKSAAALAEAQKLVAGKQHEKAYEKFQSIVKAFPGTAGAQSAAEAVAAYEKDPAFIQRVKDNAATQQAKTAMALAASYAAAGRNDLARQKYQTVIEQFPGTAIAAEAKQKMDQLR